MVMKDGKMVVWKGKKKAVYSVGHTVVWKDVEKGWNSVDMLVYEMVVVLVAWKAVKKAE